MQTAVQDTVTESISSRNQHKLYKNIQYIQK